MCLHLLLRKGQELEYKTGGTEKESDVIVTNILFTFPSLAWPLGLTDNVVVTMQLESTVMLLFQL